MASKRFLYFMSGILAIFVVVVTRVHAVPPSSTKVLYSFNGNRDGGYPDGDLVIDSAGNLYGTTVEGGDFSSGTVFRLAPSGNGWTQTVLYSFTSGADGGQPYGGVTLDQQGNLYGTAVVGGTGGSCVEAGCGVVFKLTNTGGTWSESVIHNFTGGSDGYGPGNGLIFDHHGSLYGMTPTGGADGQGVIYQLKPAGNGQWQLNVIHTFTGGADGGTGSAGRLLLDRVGNLYGVATVGGAGGDGTAYELTLAAGGKWAFHTLYAFKGQPDAGYPYGGLTFDKMGNLYGTTYYDGAHNLGSVYELIRGKGSWSETVLYSFKGGTDGSSSISTLSFDAAGNLYGTTSGGGSAGCGCGTIFKLAPAGGGKWTESTAYTFKGVPDAGFAYNGMVAGSTGNFYGTTVQGGTQNEGAIFEFTP